MKDGACGSGLLLSQEHGFVSVRGNEQALVILD